MLPGGLAVDEAVDAAKSVCNANANAMLFVFYPQVHTVLLWLLQFLISIILILPCIEIIERSMDVNEVTVNYRESGHGNDRRKLCQLGYSVSSELSFNEISTDCQARCHRYNVYDNNDICVPASEASFLWAMCTKGWPLPRARLLSKGILDHAPEHGFLIYGHLIQKNQLLRYSAQLGFLMGRHKS